MDHMCVIHVVV